MPYFSGRQEGKVSMGGVMDLRNPYKQQITKGCRGEKVTKKDVLDPANNLQTCLWICKTGWEGNKFPLRRREKEGGRKGSKRANVGSMFKFEIGKEGDTRAERMLVK